MAGVSTPGESSDNPVPINVTAMVDIIFCLCIFFMCSFHFRQLEGKMESWLPRDKGVNTTPVNNPLIEEVRIFLKFNPQASDASTAVIRQVGPHRVNTDDDLRARLREMVANFAKSGLSQVPVIIDSDPLVPWREVVNVLSVCRLEKLEKLEFAGPHT
jgi:biopolymer transport protein ExbD